MGGDREEVDGDLSRLDVEVGEDDFVVMGGEGGELFGGRVETEVEREDREDEGVDADEEDGRRRRGVQVQRGSTHC